MNVGAQASWGAGYVRRPFREIRLSGFFSFYSTFIYAKYDNVGVFVVVVVDQERALSTYLRMSIGRPLKN